MEKEESFETCFNISWSRLLEQILELGMHIGHKKESFHAKMTTQPSALRIMLNLKSARVKIYQAKKPKGEEIQRLEFSQKN